jgi:hypothetical protein
MIAEQRIRRTVKDLHGMMDASIEEMLRKGLPKKARQMVETNMKQIIDVSVYYTCNVIEDEIKRPRKER